MFHIKYNIIIDTAVKIGVADWRKIHQTIYPSADLFNHPSVSEGIKHVAGNPDLNGLAHAKTYGTDVDVYDLWGNKNESRQVYGIEPVDVPAAGAYDAVVLCVGREDFKVKGFAWVASFGKEKSVLYDVKNLLPVGLIDGRL